MIKLTDYQCSLLVIASKTPGTQEDKLKAINTVVEALKAVNPGAFKKEDTLPRRGGQPS